MTTSIVWPATLPCFRFEPYNVAPRPGSTEMTLGMVPQRAMVYQENNELVSVEMILSSAQEQALRTFFKTTTVMGTQSFLVDLLMAGTYDQREATFYGAPPTFVPEAPGYVRTAFMLLAKATLPQSLTYVLVDTEYVNIPATTIANSGSIPASPGGTIVTINVSPSQKIVITKPSMAANGNMDADAWSAYGSNGANGGLTWFNRFVVSGDSNVVLQNYNPSLNATIADALAATQAAMPMEFTGHSTYKFWSYDTPITDNRQELSLRVDIYNAVLGP